MLDLKMCLGATACLVATTLTAGCKDGSPPSLVDPGDQIAVVGQTFSLNLIASDPDGDRLNFDFRSTVPEINQHASISLTPDGQGLFTYTPVAGQEGLHIFDFVASDGDHRDVLAINIEVRGASGVDSAPTFREPQAGLVIEADDSCEEIKALRVLVEDLDSLDIELTQAPPVLSGATLTVDPSSGGKEAVWKWCPDRDDQLIFQHQLRLSADDGENSPTIKEVPIVIRPGSGDNCPGDAPSITHSPADAATIQDIPIAAEVRDDVGISAPIVYYALEDPAVGGEIDFSKLLVANMTLDDGGAQMGTWRAVIPNPIVDGVEGDTAQLYYLIEAVDTDDPEGGCNHRSNSPSDGVHRMTVTHPGDGRSGAGLCETCSSDVQCGEAGDFCVQLADGTVCASACGDGCPDGYECTPDPLTSIDGAAGQQCLPVSGSCETATGDCEGDIFDPNDDTPEGSEEFIIEFDGNYDQVICPGNEDWFALGLSEPTQLNITVDGDNPPDIDLKLVNGDLESIETATTATSNESIVTDCLDPGTYYALVDIYQGGEIPGNYTIDIEFDTAACMNAEPCCEPTEAPGCASDPELEACVCGMDEECCGEQYGWDNLCVNLARDNCQANCPIEA